MVDAEKHGLVQQQIADALFASVPSGWLSIRLLLERSGDGAGDFAHEISSPDGHPPVAPDMSLFDATFALDELLRREGGILRRGEIVLEWNDATETWTYRAEYSY